MYLLVALFGFSKSLSHRSLLYTTDLAQVNRILHLAAPFSTWISAFDAYFRLLVLERGEDLTASTKNSLLFSLLGQEGLRQFGNDPVVATMTEVATTHAIFRAAMHCRFK